MRIYDDDLLAEFRSVRECEWCHRPTPGGCEPHHLWAKGMGGGGQLDIRVNLCSLCILCHRAQHDGNRPMHCDILAVVAAREKCYQSDIEKAIYELRRLSKWASPEEVAAVIPIRRVG